MKKVIAAILSIAAIALPQEAIAQTAPFNAPHKWTDTATSKTYVFIPNQTPLAPIPGLTSLDESGQVSVMMNDCGWGSTGIDSSIVNIARVGGSIDWAGRTRGATPSCTQNSSGAWVTNNNAAVGTVITTTGAAWIRGGTGWGSFSVIKDFGKKVASKSNACGFLRVAITATRSMKNFNVGGMNYTLATIPAVTAPMICRTQGNSKIRYVPLNQ